MLKIYNTMTRREEPFEPIYGNRVNMFVCGPTVYDFSHMGHARTYIAYDIMARYLRYKGYSLFFIMNITDVDDKLINRARERGIDPLALAREHTEEFHKDMAGLGIASVNLFPKASEHVPEIISQISTLIERGYAYVVDGDVYYDISRFPEYGKLSRQNPEELKKHRIDPDPRKRNPQDFALWKSHKPGEPSWDSPWGKGRPGWHIEDTAITATYFGPTYDLHGGGMDLIFPHHEAEIAQAEAATSIKPLARFWVHAGLLNIRGERMGKSLRNFITIKEALSKHSSEVIRLYYASSHYRSPIDFDEENVKQAKEVLERLNDVLDRVASLVSVARNGLTDEDKNFLPIIEDHKREFTEAMDDDFNTPRAVSALISLAKDIDKQVSKDSSKALLQQIQATFKELGSILGLFESRREERRPRDVMAGLINLIVEVREEARRRNDWATADRIRARLREIGVQLEDTEEGTRWKMLG